MPPHAGVKGRLRRLPGWERDHPATKVALPRFSTATLTSHVQKAGNVPHISTGLSFFSSEKEMTCIDKDMTNENDYFLLGDVARLLKCMPHRIVYLLTTGQVPEPRRLGNRRLFKKDDVRRIAVKLGIKQQVGGEAKCAKNFAP
jgi:hypothetical protein